MTESQPTAEPERSDWAFTLAVAAVALLPRLFVAIAWAREPVWDGHYYHFGAERIAQGLGYSEDVIVGGVPVWKPWTHYPVGYSAILGAIYRVFGSDLAVAPVANALFGTLLVGIVHRLARYHLSQNRARVAAAITAFHPGLILYTTVLMTEPLAALLLTAAGLTCVRGRFQWRAVALAALLVGLATLVRTTSLLAAPLLALASPPPAYDALKRGVVATLVAVAVALPWTIRNCLVMDGCAFVSTNGGWNLAIGALTEDGRFRTLRASDGCPVVTGQVQQDRCWAKAGVDVILRDPIRWMSLAPKKLSHTYDHESFAVEYLREADPRSWPEARRVAGRALLTGFHQALLVFAMLGAIALPRGRRENPTAFWVQCALLVATLAFAAFAFASDEHPFWILATVLPVLALAPVPGAPSFGPVGRYLVALVLLTTVTHVLFFGDDRYHLVVTPAFCILAAGALRRPKIA